MLLSSLSYGQLIAKIIVTVTNHFCNMTIRSQFNNSQAVVIETRCPVKVKTYK
jgi:hypothetical protein